MKNTALLLPAAQLKKFETMRENFLRITNQYYGSIIRRQVVYTEDFKNKLINILGENFSLHVSGNWITVYSKEFKSTYRDMMEVASVHLSEMEINFRRKGASMRSKQVKLSRNFTPERVASYILRFGVK